MDALMQAVLAGASPEELARTPLPPTYRAAYLRAEDAGIFAGRNDKDVRESLHVGNVPMPDLAPDEVLVAMMASSINYNTVWSATFEPLPTFTFLRRLGRQGGFAARHDQPYHVIGSDGSGVVVRVGAAVRRWKIGDRVVMSGAYVDDQDPATHNDSMLSGTQLAWGFETNFGGLAHYGVLRASQLLPKPAHLTWEEAASITLCAGTSYRMLVGEHGARIKQGDVVLVWGATGGLGLYAMQLVKNGGGIPVGVVGSEQKAKVLRQLGFDFVINRQEIGLEASGAEPVAEAGKRLGRRIRQEVGEDPHVVFDPVGRSTFGLSVFVVRRGGVVVTCGSSTGYLHEFDNRYLWMHLKRIIGSHVANLQEKAECVRLFDLGHLMPMVSCVHPLDEVGEAARTVQLNEHLGKVAVLCMAPHSGLGVTDPGRRARIGEDRLDPFMTLPRNAGPAPAPPHPAGV
ncbi:crotonyl-CoA carboxylase/reductase [Streptomyces olivaceoviridis]|uniref:crotonyl-CoA carboxylase/reductase n=1 Tax=Streptomyces olivaceoviridis TaxID=1921 RepID=UPI0033A76146